MNFAKRQVTGIIIQRNGQTIYSADATDTKLLTIFAHQDDDTGSQLLGIEGVDKVTGEVITQRINLPTSDMYLVSIKEILLIQE